jgi:hypothetical protein
MNIFALLPSFLSGEPMSDVCRAFGISQKVRDTLFERCREEGPVALADRSRRPVRYANQLPAQVEMPIVASKREKPHWVPLRAQRRVILFFCPIRASSANQISSGLPSASLAAISARRVGSSF